jgi:NAD(P)-dependent dehydrogenase (short-subunit alcohol dehydrogenase family)
MKFAGKVALVTGAAGQIGAATALRLADLGATVAVADRDPSSVEALAAECERRSEQSALAVGIDQIHRGEVDEGIELIRQRLGPIDLLFANAGYGQFMPFLEVSAKHWQRHVDVNLSGTFHVAQAAARSMVEHRRHGAIVLNASSGAHVYCDQLVAYCTTKAAVRMLAVGMAAELGTHRIRVNCVMPGVVETGMTSPNLSDARHRDVMESETPVGRLGTAEDIAGLVAFLLSEDAGYINGAAIPIDGGQTIHGYPRWFRLDYRRTHDDSWTIPE